MHITNTMHPLVTRNSRKRSEHQKLILNKCRNLVIVWSPPSYRAENVRFKGSLSFALSWMLHFQDCLHHQSKKSRLVQNKCVQKYSALQRSITGKLPLLLSAASPAIIYVHLLGRPLLDKISTFPGSSRVFWEVPPKMSNVHLVVAGILKFSQGLSPGMTELESLSIFFFNSEWRWKLLTG